MKLCPLRAVVLAALVVPAVAQAQAASDAQRDPKTLDQVIVTGTRVTDRTVAESTSPIDIISPETLEATGSIELGTALARALPSLNFPRPAISDGTDAVRPAQLRGMAPDQVLVLVNGKRRHPTALINVNDTVGRGSSPVDFNAIPVAAIERVEVLRDGASAQYGSDAIAGVINIVLKGKGENGSLDLHTGQYSAGDGRQAQLSGDAGIALGANGWLRLAAQAGHQDNTNRARPFGGVVGPTTVSPGKVWQRYGDPEVDQGAFSFNAEWEAAPGVAFYSFGTISHRDILSNGYYRAPGNRRNVPAIYPNGFLPQIRNIANDRAMVLGLRAETALGWDMDLSLNHGLNHLTFDIENSLNRSLGAASPTQFYAGALETTQNLLNLDVSRTVDVGMEYPLAVALGAEWRGEKFNLGPGEAASYADGNLILADGGRAPPGSQVFPGFQPSDSGHYNRNSTAFYVDLEMDLSQKFTVGLAGRAESYSDFGDTTSGKFSARYAITDAFALRGTASTGFRAPSLQQQHFQSTATNFVGGIPFEIRTFGVNTPVGIALGAEPLRAEESVNYSLGAVLQPIEGLYVTVDAFQVEVDDRIILSENLLGDDVRRFLERQGIFGVTGGRYFTNAVDTRTRGIDVVGTYRSELEGGSAIDWLLGYSRNKTDVTAIAPNPPELSQGGLNLQRIGRVEEGRITRGMPSDKLTLGSTWTSGDWRVAATATRYGEMTDFNADPRYDQTFGAEWTLDLSAAYTMDRWTFMLGADNVLDEYPDELIFQTSDDAQLPYSRAAPFGFNGAFVYGRVTYRW